MNICVIPARGGSKRIPHKNIRHFRGKPIIAYSIAAARDSGCFDRIIVSTEDPEIRETANTFGAETPFERPAELSDDFAGTGDVMAHAVAWARDAGLDIAYACCVYATAPLLMPEFLRESYDLIRADPALEYCFSATEYSAPIQRALKCRTDGRAEMFDPEQFVARSQDLEPAYHDAAQFYWGTADAWLTDSRIFLRAPLIYPLPRSHVEDIDTPEDWRRAELMHQALNAEIP